MDESRGDSTLGTLFTESTAVIAVSDLSLRPHKKRLWIYKSIPGGTWASCSPEGRFKSQALLDEEALLTGLRQRFEIL